MKDHHFVDMWTYYFLSETPRVLCIHFVILVQGPAITSICDIFKYKRGPISNETKQYGTNIYYTMCCQLDRPMWGLFWQPSIFFHYYVKKKKKNYSFISFHKRYFWILLDISKIRVYFATQCWYTDFKLKKYYWYQINAYLDNICGN